MTRLLRTLPSFATICLCAISSLAGAQAQVAAPAPAATPSAAASKAPPSRDSLRGIEHRGRLLAQHDFIAWTASDSLLARRVPLTRETRYVVRRTSDSTWEALFGRLNAARDTFFVDYQLRQDPVAFERLLVEVLATPRADTGFPLRASLAIEQARKELGPQSRPYNTAVLERPDGELYVYLVPAQVRAGVFPLGADVRYHFSRDGRRLIATRRLHNTIIEFAMQGGKDAPVASTHSAVLDDIPEDTDVFHVLVREPRVPEYIVSDAFVYRITPDGRIALLGRRQDVLGK